MKISPISQTVRKQVWLWLVVIGAVTFAGCFRAKVPVKVPVLLSVTNADKQTLLSEVNRFAAVDSLRAKVDIKFEDNSFAESGISEKYKTAPGQVIVQSPGKINFKIEVPVVGQDIVQMTSDGTGFRVAVIYGVDEKYKKFVYGTNAGDYSRLQEKVQQVTVKGGDVGKSISAFASLRPQHFTDAVLMRPIQTGEDYVYAQSEIYQEEDAEPNTTRKTTAIARVVRGYYLLDELRRDGTNDFTIMRRFWFDRIGGTRLAKQQIFDQSGATVADITYGAEGALGEGQSVRLPLRVEIVRPQEKYKVSLTYQTPAAVVIGQQYNPAVFQLENKWQLPEVDLDKQQQQSNQQTTGLNP